MVTEHVTIRGKSVEVIKGTSGKMYQVRAFPKSTFKVTVENGTSQAAKSSK
jgi:hypothetical protein